MRRIFLFGLIFQLAAFFSSAQDLSDTIPPAEPANAPVLTPARIPARTDTIKPVMRDTSRPSVVSRSVSRFGEDSLCRRPVLNIAQWKIQVDVPLAVQIERNHPFYNFRVRPFAVPSTKKIFKGKETMFYAIAGLLLFFALLRLSFAKYFSDLFRVFFRTTMKQRQIREQLMQTPLPSLGFNLFFLLTSSLYAGFILFYYGFKPVENFWLLCLYCCIGLLVIYLGKFIALKIFGWMFNMRQAADSYIFIVFIINKMIGVFLLPFLVLLAFSKEPIQSVAVTLSWCGLVLLFLYRFILGFGAVRNEVRFNLFHFFLYICAFEVAPLLLIYKLLLFFFK